MRPLPQLIRPSIQEPPGSDEKNSPSPASAELPYRAASDQATEPDSRSLVEYGRVLRRSKGTLILIALSGRIDRISRHAPPNTHLPGPHVA